jgi:hypothetical protein
VAAQLAASQEGLSCMSEGVSECQVLTEGQVVLVVVAVSTHSLIKPEYTAHISEYIIPEFSCLIEMVLIYCRRNLLCPIKVYFSIHQAAFTRQLLIKNKPNCIAVHFKYFSENVWRRFIRFFVKTIR